MPIARGDIARSLEFAEEVTAARDRGRLELEDGSRVAIVGGGPAGSLFAYFALRMAATVGVRLDVELFEPRHFTHRGPAGCNHCGGIISESLVQMLAAEGIRIPSEVLQRGIDSYVLHMDVGTVRIDTPLREKRIAAVYRGNGPRQGPLLAHPGFDRFLQDLAADSGARIVRRLVDDVQREDDGRLRVSTPQGTAGTYDLVAIASGVNSNLGRLLAERGVPHRPPGTMTTFICEYALGRATVEAAFGDSMHVFLLDLPDLEFAALIPKGDFVTLCMLGTRIDESLVTAFLDTPEVRACFPDGAAPTPACHCFPRINLQPHGPAFADRLVFVGDSGVARLYKDGIGSAYRTAKAAAVTAVFQGVSEGAFRKHFAPALRRIEIDNTLGRIVFGVGHLIQKSRFTRRGVLRMTEGEQRSTDGARTLSTVLWDMFTGSAPYREILVRTLNPAFGARLAWNLIASNGPGRIARREA